MGCCRTFSGIARGCDPSVGGIKKAWIACYDSVTPTVVDNQITSLTNSGEGFKEFEFKKQTGSVTQSFQAGDSNYYEQTITLQFARQETAKQIEINALAVGDLVVIIQDNNGKYWYFGFDNPVTMSGNEATTGTAFSDLNGYDITLLGTDFQLAYEVSEAVMASIVG